jgi:two-component system OmpR family sensor kinase
VRPSLTRRLLTLHVVTIVLVVGMASVLVWVLMRRALHAGLDDTLRTEALALAARLEAEGGRIEFERRPSDLDGSAPAEPRVQILDEHLHTVFCSPALLNDPTVPGWLSAAAAADSPLWLTAPFPPGGELSRAVALHVDVAPEEEFWVGRIGSSRVGAWVVAARSTAPIGRTLSQLASVLGSAVGAAVLVGVAGALLVARRGTRPVRALAESVGRVDPSHPRLILENGQVPQELQPIVSTTQRLLQRVGDELVRQRQLTADVAHDLRTPVAGVRTLLDVCLQSPRTTGEYTAAMDKARGALRQLSHLLDEVLTLARLDARVDQPVLVAAALKDIIDGAVATAAPLAAARRVTIHRAECPAAELRTDPGMLAKILSNLLSNAVEHSPPGETVHIAAQAGSNTLEISIADRGPGIPEALRGRIFDRFVRGDAARAGVEGHHGLGLPIAAGLARLLGGQVRLDESHAPGSRFVVRLPLN